MATQDFRGKVVLITGASSGIGRAVARVYAAQRAHLVRASRRGSRETVLTLPGRVMVLANRLVPGLFDRVARRIANPARRP